MRVIRYGDITPELINEINELVDLIWWDDYRGNDLEFSVVSNHMKNPVISNAYSYEKRGDRVRYCTAIPSDWREYTYAEYGKACGIDFGFIKIDYYTYEINSYNYYKDNINAIQLTNIMYQFLRFREVPVNTKGYLAALHEFRDKSLEFDDTYGELLTQLVDDFCVSDFGFCQGNADIMRLQSKGKYLFFDYVGFYEKPFAYSYLKDFAQLLISFKKSKQYNNINLILRFMERHNINKDGILMFILLENTTHTIKDFFIDELY